MTQFQAGLFDELTPLYPDTPVSEGTASYEVAGANGSYVGVHIAVSGLTPGLPVSIQVQGPHRAYKMFRLIPVPVEVNTGADQRTEYLKDDHNEYVIRRAPFYIYDPMEPIFNLALPEYPTAAFVFRTPIEYCRTRETKTWTITLRHNGQEQVLTLNVEQFPVQIPKASRDTYQFVNWFSMKDISERHHVVMWSAQFYQLLEKYMRAAVYTRQNIFNIQPGDVFELDENGDPRLLEDRLEKIIATARRAGITLFQGNALCGRASWVSDDDAFWNSLDHDSFTTPEQINDAFKFQAFDLFDHGTDARFGLTGALISTETGRRQLRLALTQLSRFITAHGLQDSWLQSCLDEPNDELCETYRVIVGITREAMPGIPILEPVLPTEKVAGMVDIWCPTLYNYEHNREFFEDRVKKGDRLYVYSCLTPGGNYLNRLQDMERLRVVYLAWAPLLYPSIEGFLHWGANQTPYGDPFCRQADLEGPYLNYHPKYANFLPAGDMCILYPGRDEPWISTRSEAHRIGFEDNYLLTELRKKDPEKTLDIVRSIVRGYADYSKSVADYRRTRKELLETACQLL